MSRPPDELIETGRDALKRHQWQEAYAALSAADAQGSMTGEGLELLAYAAYWTAHPDEARRGGPRRVALMETREIRVGSV